MTGGPLRSGRRPAAEGGRPRLFGSRFDRGVGVMLMACGLLAAAGVLLVPIPDFDALTPRAGTLVDARRERFSPCRRSVSTC